MNCASCGATFEDEKGGGPGRPKAYCSDACKRLAEHRIRIVVRRLDRLEVALRECLAGWGPPYISHKNERRARVRTLRRWIDEDEATLRRLVGANPKG